MWAKQYPWAHMGKLRQDCSRPQEGWALDLEQGSPGLRGALAGPLLRLVSVTGIMDPVPRQGCGRASEAVPAARPEPAIPALLPAACKRGDSPTAAQGACRPLPSWVLTWPAPARAPLSCSRGPWSIWPGVIYSGGIFRSVSGPVPSAHGPAPLSWPVVRISWGPMACETREGGWDPALSSPCAPVMSLSRAGSRGADKRCLHSACPVPAACSCLGSSRERTSLALQ